MTPSQNSHQGMRKPHFRPVYDATPHAFHQCEDIMVFRIENNPVERVHGCCARMGADLRHRELAGLFFSENIFAVGQSEEEESRDSP
jgi:hypothetical protein